MSHPQFPASSPVSGLPRPTPRGQVLLFPKLPAARCRFLLLDYPAVMYPCLRAPLWFRRAAGRVAVLVTPPLSLTGETSC